MRPTASDSGAAVGSNVCAVVGGVGKARIHLEVVRAVVEADAVARFCDFRRRHGRDLRRQREHALRGVKVVDDVRGGGRGPRGRGTEKRADDAGPHLRPQFSADRVERPRHGGRSCRLPRGHNLQLVAWWCFRAGFRPPGSGCENHVLIEPFCSLSRAGSGDRQSFCLQAFFTLLVSYRPLADYALRKCASQVAT